MSGADIVALETPLQLDQAACVTILEEALTDARAGKIAAVAVAMVETAGPVITTCSRSSRVYALLGAVAMLQHRIMAAKDEDPHKPRDKH